MGSSLSRQEELFLRRQWSALLEAAIAADTEAMEADASSGAAASASSSTTRGPRTAKAGFALSFQEWQAFLAVLERRGAATEATSAPSDICATLTAAQLHVPAVALMVHLCVWWGGAIPTDVLADRLDHLLRLVAGLRHGREPPSTSAEEERGSGGTPAGRRARLARFVQQRVAHLGKAHPTGNADATAATTTPGEKEQQQRMQLDTFADMTVLTQHLLHQEGLPAGDSCDDAGPIGTDAAALFELYDEKIGNPDALKQRPVLAVVMVTVLAVYACKVRDQPQLAVRSIVHLAALEQMMMASAAPAQHAPSGTSAAKTSGGAASAAAAASPLAVAWPLIGALEVALVHRQHESDARRSAGSDGDDLRATLRQMRASRTALPRDEHAAASRSPDERWAAGASQYVGQRPIWAALRSHFLSAGIFDADKPTVLVFFGPSGYGKSELARRVASVLHGVPMSALEGSGKLVYIHMPSFCTKDSIYSLVDPPAAHVGSGILLSALQKHPDAVVVLDEFEKSTAEAINNLWLSAFQKNGVLRSLKEASRSVSTVRTTFILTCNIAADSIAAREGLYLGAAPADQEKIRGLFETQCKDVCRDTMGEPFVNRVDAFFPFMPYTRAERRQFVCLLLERLLTSQAGKGRHLYATPGFVDAMVDRLHTFHAATLEDAVRAQVLRMARAGWTTGVLTVERHVRGGGGGGVPVLLPAHAAELQSGAAPAGDDDVESGGRSLLVEAWESLPGGSTSLARWTASTAAAAAAATATATATAGASADAMPAASHVAPPPPAEAHVDAAATAATSSAAAFTAPRRGKPGPPAELEKEYVYAVDTERVTELEKELAATRELVRQRDLEIVTLKEKVLLLQKALALLLVSLLSCLCLMALVIGLKLTLVFALAVVGCLVLVLGVPLSVLLDAVRGLFHLLGPYKAGGLAVLLLAWLARASRSAASACP